MHPSPAVLLCLLALAGPATAQEPRPDPVRPHTAETYSEADSRELFRGCDGDSDDRLDLFEATDALETLPDPQRTEDFARLDTDRDGFLSWPEFDQHFRAVIGRGQALRVRPCRRLQPVPKPTAALPPATPMQRLVQRFDQDQDGGLDPTELEQLVRQLQLPPAMGRQLRALDTDLSGRLDAEELAPLLQRFPLLQLLAGGAAARPASPLPAPFGAADQNGDGRVDADELAGALRRLDPSLVRWAAQLLRAHDKNGDGALGADELPGGGAPAGRASS